jgi:hypothetical protein
MSWRPSPGRPDLVGDCVDLGLAEIVDKSTRPTAHQQ